MIEAEDRSAELLTLRVRPRMVKTINEEQGRREHHQQGWQIHLAEEEICPKNRSHPLLLRVTLTSQKVENGDLGDGSSSIHLSMARTSALSTTASPARVALFPLSFIRRLQPKIRLGEMPWRPAE